MVVLCVSSIRKEDTMRELKEIEVKNRKISTRTMNLLYKNNVRTLKELCEHESEYFRTLHGFGVKAVEEVELFLEKLGLSLGDKKNWQETHHFLHDASLKGMYRNAPRGWFSLANVTKKIR